MRPALFALVLLLPAPLAGQIPDEFRNLRFFPEDISRDSLIGVMRGFSFALGVRCQYCHVGGDGVSLQGVEFDSDDDPDKRKARFMLEMVRHLNQEILPELPERDTPPVAVECKTCHRGLARPVLLTQELRMVLDRAGIDSAVARYRELRAERGMRGAYDFGEWEMNSFAEALADEGRLWDAIAIYRLNEEFFDESVSIKVSLGQLYERVGERERAMAYYERALTIRPDLDQARARLDSLRSGRR